MKLRNEHMTKLYYTIDGWNVTPIIYVPPIRRDIFIPLDWTTFTLWAVREGVRDSEREIFGLLSPNWKLKSRGGGGSPSLVSVAMPHNYVSKRGDVRREAECDAGGQVDVGETSIYLTSSCTRVVRPSSGSAVVYWQKLHRNIPSPSAVPVCIVLGNCWRARGLKRIASHEKHNNLHHRCDLREIPSDAN